MDTNTLIIVAAVVVALIIVVMLIGKARRSAHLKSQFGDEYDRTVEAVGDKHKAKVELRDREKRVKAFDLRPLHPADRTRFTTAWTAVQAEFVDDPRAAVSHADELVTEVMTTRGYPMTDFDQRYADLSVDYPHVVQNYRSGHDSYLKHTRGDAGTEDLRQAMIHYRALFEDLAKVDVDPAKPA